MPDYIPRKEYERLVWLWHFSEWMVTKDAANAIAHGFTLEEACALFFTILQTKLAFDNEAQKLHAARAATIEKNNAITQAIKLGRAYAQRLQTRPTTTDEDRAAAGITIHDTKPTRTPKDAPLNLPPPLLRLDFSKRRQVTIHWGPNPSNENKNARPKNAIGCELQYHPGGIPNNESAWQTLAIDTASPFVHTLTETEPTTYAYRARYVGKSLGYGPFSEAVTVSINP